MADELSDIRVLPLDVRRHVLSFLPTEVGARASTLMKAWRDEFARTSSLEFELTRGRNENQFIDFVNRIVALRRQGGADPLSKFHLSISLEIDEETYVDPWIEFALENRVADLKLCLYELWSYEYELPQAIFVSNFLVKLKLGSSGFVPLIAPDVNVYLPSLKTLYLETVSFGPTGAGFHNLLAGCPAIEELIMEDIEWFNWVSSTVSSRSLKRLRIFWDLHMPEDERTSSPSNVSFDTPALLQLDYMDDTAASYPQLDFSSLVEAKLLLHLRGFGGEDDELAEGEEEVELAEEHATDFVDAIRNARKLYLYADTLQGMIVSLCISP